MEHGTDTVSGKNAIKPSNLLGFIRSDNNLEPVARPSPRQITSMVGKKLYATLIAAGIDEDLSDSLTSPIDVSFETVARSLAARISIYPNFIADTDCETPEILALLGPTGSGKTTTVAKIAALATFQYNLQVGLITFGAIRIASEQLKTYAEIMGSPFRAVENQEQFDSAMASLSECDLVLMDTAGKNDGGISNDVKLAGILARSPNTRKSLVLSATTQPSELAEIVRDYELLGIDCLIFTNLDETTSHGPIVGELLRSRLPLAWVTTGRGIPKDIVRLEPRQLVDLALGPERTNAWEQLVQSTRAAHSSREKDSRNSTTRRVSP